MIFRIVCENNVYPWAIGEYIEKFSTAYLKIEALRTILLMYNSNMIFDENIFIKTKNIDIYNKKSIENKYFAEAQTSIVSYNEAVKNQYYLFGKSENPEMFWNIFSTNTRPDIYIKKDFGFIQLIDTPGSSFRFKKIEVNSPPFFDLEGAGSTIIDLFYAGEREDRKRIEFQNGMVNQSLTNLQGIIRTEELIDTSTVTSGLKEYARQQLKHLMSKQNIINEKIGVIELHINETA